MPRKVCCVRCGRHVSEAGPLTARKRCFDCGIGVMVENARQLAAKQGPAYDRWRAAMLDAVANLYRTPDPSTAEIFDAELVEIFDADAERMLPS